MASPNNLPDFDTLWDYDRPSETERRFRELLPYAEASGDADYYLELLTQIARAQGLQRQFDEAHATLDYVMDYLDGLPTQTTVRYLLERGRVFNSSKQRDEARPLFFEAWRIASDLGADRYAVDAAHMLAIVEPPEQQMEWNLVALNLAENSADPKARRWLGSLYNNIGWTYHQNGQYEEALKTFVKALAWREAQNQPKEARIARWCVGRALRSLGRYEEALAVQTEVAALIAASGDEDGYVSEEIGECLLALGREDESRDYFARAYEVLSADAWLADNEPDRLTRLSQLAGFG